MSVLGLAAGAAASLIGQMASSTASQQKQVQQLPQTLSNVDQAGSSVAGAPSITGKIGSRIDITA
jgi:hypothetical protein